MGIKDNLTVKLFRKIMLSNLQFVIENLVTILYKVCCSTLYMKINHKIALADLCCTGTRRLTKAKIYLPIPLLYLFIVFERCYKQTNKQTNNILFRSIVHTYFKS